ncbi:MAG: helix-turn-helix transcriptional regulator [Clostridia bacterium]|nr:helix-turn-helix transcriptional regulator [Clostridia bacterium]
MEISGSERGYLREEFRLFHTIDQKELKVDWHFHTFDKIVLFRSGHVSYTVESQTAQLSPGDLLVISHGQLHRMHSFSDVPYERYILYLNSAFLASLAPEAGGLNACFIRARTGGQSLLRLPEADRAAIYSLFSRMEKAIQEASPYAPALSRALLTELLVLICRAPEQSNISHPDAPSDEKIAQALHYIQSHLTEKLTCDALSAHLRMSRSSFQHRFKAATGHAPYAYIKLQRLLLASELLSAGEGALSAGKKCGYSDHSAFCHAFFEQFGVTPSSFRPRRDELTGPQE